MKEFNFTTGEEYYTPDLAEAFKDLDRENDSSRLKGVKTMVLEGGDEVITDIVDQTGEAIAQDINFSMEKHMDEKRKAYARIIGNIGEIVTVVTENYDELSIWLENARIEKGKILITGKPA